VGKLARLNYACLDSQHNISTAEKQAIALLDNREFCDIDIQGDLRVI
jgi:hypothetical protein